MSTQHMETYLAAALDQEACKATLIAALTSRVVELRDRGIAVPTLITSLENLCDDPYQLHDDIIEHVIEWLLVENKKR